jgi:hypothetical protein
MESQINQPKDKDTSNTSNKDNTEEHNTDHKTLLRPKAGILNQSLDRTQVRQSECFYFYENFQVCKLAELIFLPFYR